MSVLSGSLYLLIISFTLALHFYLRTRRTKKRGRFPPGPPKKPIIGNMLDLNPYGPPHWKVFMEWKKIYGTSSLLSLCHKLIYDFAGDLVGLDVLGTKILILNSEKTITDLLEHRGHIYSDRPKFTVLGELMGLERVSDSVSICMLAKF